MNKSWSRLISKAEKELRRNKALIDSSFRGVSGTHKKYKRTSPSKVRER